MKKIDDLIENFDKQVDRKMAPWYKVFSKYFVLFSTTFFSLLILIFVFRVYYNKPHFIATVIQSDLKNISTILDDIDKNCNILNLKEDRVSIDFLTVAKFVGSEIGGLNLAYPKKWKGPYLKNGLSFQQRPYELVKAKDGVFLIPGNGSTLPNNYTVGKDFLISPLTAVAPMMQPGGYLFYKNAPLAIKITFKIGDWDSRLRLTNETIDDVNSLLKEFNSAIPYSQNEVQQTTQA